MPSKKQSYSASQSEIWKEWACKAQDGDQKAYHKLLSDLAPYIRNFVIKGLANPEWADDIAQEVLISIHKSLHTYSPERPFRPWLMAIINFRRTDFLRKHYSARQNMQTDLDNLDFQKNHVTNPTHAGELKDIEAALSRLPAKQRKLFELVKVKGYSMDEAANDMDMSVSAVKVSIHRTLKKLQADMG